MSNTPLTLDLMRAVFPLLLGRAPENDARLEASAEHFGTVENLRRTFAQYPEVMRSVFDIISAQIPFDVINVRSKRG